MHWVRLLCLLSALQVTDVTAALPPEQTLRSVVSVGETFVAVGNSGTIVSSINGGPQLIRDSATTNTLESVAWGNGVYVAAGVDGLVVSSTDGLSWSAKRVAAQMTSPRVAYGNGRFVVMGKGRPGFWSVLVSANAIDWTAAEVVSTGPATATNGLPFAGMTFGAGKFLAAGGVDSANLVVTSPDGLFWSEQGTVGLVGGNNGAIEGPLTYGAGLFAVKVTFINRDEYGNVFPRSQSVAVSEDGAQWRGLGTPVTPFHSLSISDCGLLVSSPNLGPNGAFLGLRFPQTTVAPNRWPSFFWIPLVSASPISVSNTTSLGGKPLAVGSDVKQLDYAPSLLPIFLEYTYVPEGSNAVVMAIAPCDLAAGSYQWFFNSRVLSGATNSTLNLVNMQTNQSGYYSYTLQNSGGRTNIGAAVQIIVTPPTIPENPTPVAPGILAGFPIPTNQVVRGGNLDLGVGISGWPFPALQWSRDGKVLDGETNSFLRLYGVTSQAVGNYAISARNSMGSTSSIVARVELAQATAPPSITNQVSLEFFEGQTAFLNLSGLPSSSQLTSLQLLKDGLNPNLPLETVDSVRLFEVSEADQGNYVLVGKNEQGEGNSVRVQLDVSPSAPLQVWKQRSPRPGTLNSVVYGDSRFVAVGEGGSFATSTDGRDWSFYRLPASINFNEVAFGNGRYVAVGSSSVVVSSDGLQWTVALNLTGERAESVAFAGGRFFLISRTRLLSSTDGTTWTPVTLPQLGYRNLLHLAFGNGIYVAVGAFGSVWTSANGQDWVPRATEIGGELENIKFAGGTFIAVGSGGALWTSTDGISWKERDSETSNRLHGTAFGNGKFIAVGNRGRVISSSKGSNWKKEDSGQPNRLESVAFAAGLFVAVGEDGVILTSTDGTTWAPVHPGPTRDLDGLITDSQRLIIVGKGGLIVTTTNGVDFSRASTGLTNDLHGIGWSGNMYVAVGEPETILSSPDAVQWTIRNQSTNSSLKSVKWAAGMWVAVGTQGAIWTSYDGISWTSRRSSTLNDLNDVAFGDGRFVVVGDNLPPNGTVLTSSDGINWTRGNQYIGKNLRSVAYLNGSFVATANDGLILVSTNGTAWEPRFTGYLNNLRAVGHAANEWILVGNEGLILHSPDQNSWNHSISPSIENLHQVVYFDSRFYAIGNRGTVVASDRFVRAAELSAQLVQDHLELSIIGDLGVVYRLEATDRLPAVSWTTLSSFQLTQSPQRIADPEPARGTARFYRVVSP